MTRPRIVLFLRIAMSVVCLIPCCLLIGLWVRSYSYQDVLHLDFGVSLIFRVFSREGVVNFSPWVVSRPRPSPMQSDFMFAQRPVWQADIDEANARRRDPSRRLPNRRPWRYFKYDFPTGDVEHDIFVPYWFLALMASTLVAVPWLPWSCRFSLRSVLLATTLVAAVLGLFVAMR
jgi:hypothetical protein